MIIGIDIQSTVGVYSGLGVYTRSISEALASGQDSTKPFCHQSDEFHFFFEQPARHWNTLDRLWWENHVLPQKALKEGVDLLHVPAFSPPVRRPGKIKIVTTVHDLIGRQFSQRGPDFAMRFFLLEFIDRTPR